LLFSLYKYKIFQRVEKCIVNIPERNGRSQINDKM
jgi:hypothetical protein